MFKKQEKKFYIGKLKVKKENEFTNNKQNRKLNEAVFPTY